MSKIRIYIEKDAIVPSMRIEDRSIIHKIKNVLRLNKNDNLYIFDGEGREYFAKIKDLTKTCVLIENKKLERKEDLPRKRIGLGFPILREDKVDFILEKATELGVSDFYPFICSRSLKNIPSFSKLQRWQKIAIEAARQSERLWLTRIHKTLDFKGILKVKFKTKFVAEILGESLPKIDLKDSGEIFLIVGPTGDFSPQEKALLKENDFISLRLSLNLLKTETAAAFGCGLINYLLNQ